MNNTNQITILLSSLATQLPVLIVCLAACVIILINWEKASRGAIWALAGFGLALVLWIVIPIVQVSMQSLLMSGNLTIVSRTSIFTGLSVFWALLRALSYALILVGVFAGRATPGTTFPPASSSRDGNPPVA